MSKHDSWVFLQSDSPLKDIVEFFPQGFPTQDPFAIKYDPIVNGRLVSYWAVDFERIALDQRIHLASAYARYLELPIEQLFEEFELRGCYIPDAWVEALDCGIEGRAREAELREFWANNPKLTVELREQFFADQREKWINGDAVPEPELYVSQVLRGRF